MQEETVPAQEAQPGKSPKNSPKKPRKKPRGKRTDDDEDSLGHGQQDTNKRMYWREKILKNNDSSEFYTGKKISWARQFASTPIPCK